ncbi:HAMP domain-containing sensor histidine kinase [Ruegeria sp. Ofav3-42]|uniref:sensor histidine kinase n=1 Tax=Ruegeria sp. Ofav3-42 TaxID=2917759 RepID=UPI001EF695A7|nr:HAMP domain-containing sensor histidine kinase [Ruegeria sp. Ofav3-42]MCG7522006.1 HAMP domain-containing histidine kinase [Ruegeria sp. Ofav3-42]
MSSLRQTIGLLVCLLALQLLGAMAASTIIHVEFSNQIKDELSKRFKVVASEVEMNGFRPEDFPSYRGEVVFFQADETSAATAPEGIFEVRGAIEDDLWEENKLFGTNPDWDDWYFFVGEAAGSVLVIGTNLAYSSLFSGLIPNVFIAVGVCISVIALAIGFAMSRRAQNKLDRMSTVLAEIGRGNLHQRVALSTDRDDLDDLAQDIDNTLEHLEVLFNQTKNLAVNIAHDLKTPLARLRLRLENALLDTDPDIVAQNVELALKQADHVIAVFEAFLRIARLETGTAKKRFADVDLVAVAKEIASTFAPVVEDAGYGFELRINGRARIKGDAVLLTQMLSNLIENAIRHTDPGTVISVVVDYAGVGVADTGKGIPDDAYEQVVKPSVRLDASRTKPGAGLGLALVKSIADAHEATLELTENPWSEERGLFVFARFREVWTT